MKTPLPRHLKLLMAGAIFLFFFALMGLWYVVLDQGTRPLSFIFTDALSMAVTAIFVLAGVGAILFALVQISAYRWRERNRIEEGNRIWNL